jgi:PII-like signaling protein
MQGIGLRFYVQESRTHHRVLVYEWLLEQAKRLGIHGGSAFKALAGFGRHGMLHEDHFFELAGHLPVVVEFVVSAEDADRLLTSVQAEEVTVFYTRTPLEFGWIKGPKD